jgi:pimeloyl-ACP methyl ester carboxylesterase
VLTICLCVLALAQAADTGRTKSGLWYSQSGSGEPVVLLHGSNLDSRAWGTLPNALARTHRVVLSDLRAHGHSSDASGSFSWSEDVIEVMDAARIERAVLVGHSLGAQIAIDAALTHPDRVAALVLIAPAIGGKPVNTPPAGIEELVAALRAGDMERAGAALAQMPVMKLWSDTSQQDSVRRIVRDNTRLFRARREWIRQVEPAAIGRLAELRMPVLVLLGAADPTESNDAGELLSRRLEDVTVRTLPRCGHLVPLDCPGATRDAIASFLVRFARQR